jgi:hypothetical protein
MTASTLEPTFIIQVQMAIIGVILVTGLFYIWRTVCRIEEKIDRDRCGCPFPADKNPSFPPQTCEVRTNSSASEGAEDEEGFELATTPEEIMKSVFGDVFVLGGMMGAGSAVNAGSRIQVTEITDQPDNDNEEEEEPVVVKESSHVDADADADADADETPSVASTGALTKTKLNKMSQNLLKELCTQRGLSSEGTKAVLVDRILGSV